MNTQSLKDEEKAIDQYSAIFFITPFEKGDP